MRGMSYSVRRAHDPELRRQARTLLQHALDTDDGLFADAPDARFAEAVAALGGLPQTVLVAVAHGTAGADATASAPSPFVIGAAVVGSDLDVGRAIATGIDDRTAAAFLQQWAVVSHLAVAASHRGQGVGRALVDATEAIAAVAPTRAGMHAFALDAEHPSAPFFAACGWRVEDADRVTLPMLPPGASRPLPVPLSRPEGARPGRFVTHSLSARRR
ncbi:GNAT family N-acetyltransferase [Pseudoclavibacter caeni]|jgi:GNAT superfamily N-acetyltransferase|uniref:GNAT family N-acetyltransferase n=2 Tax=Pseudoclavibacter caeni TaxID=908846 RepID=A0A7C8BSH5_9MICO|nr:GNAT family N-acetyltransferase [Pseudoclavibacter caeni]